MSIYQVVLAIAGGLRTPDERTDHSSTHPASVGRRLLVVFACLTILLGCGEKDTPETTEDAIDAPGWVLGVIDADKITALRQDAAAQGKVLVIDCWATWCGSCIAMFPDLHAAMKQRSDDVYLVSLSFDEGEALTEQARTFLEKQNATHNAYRAAEGNDAKDAIAKALSPNWDGGALPAVFVYAPDGSIALQFTETRGDVEDWVKEITTAVDASLSE